MRSRLSKLGLMTMAAVLAVGLCGAVFASWTDQLVVQGQVETGEVNLVIEDTSKTIVYKDLDDSSMIVWTTGDDPVDPVADNLLEVAKAYVSDYDVDGDAATMVFDNVFPGPLFCADLLVHYWGVPGHVSVSDFDVPGALAPYIWWEIVWPDSSTSTGGSVPADWPNGTLSTTFVSDGFYQLHECQTFKVNIYCQIPQNMSLVGVTDSVTMELTAEQFNECTPEIQKIQDLPEGKVNIDITSNYNGAGGYFKVDFGQASGYDPPPATLTSVNPWDAYCCEKENSSIMNIDVTLKSSLEAPYSDNPAWNKINWVLNQPTYMGWDYGTNAKVTLDPFGQVYAGSPAQVAFWYFLFGDDVHPIEANAQTIIDAAAAHADFVPGPGQFAAVICEDGSSYQTVFVSIDP